MRAGERIAGRFLLQERLERTTWLGHDERLGRDVVLKQVAAGESRAMARLNHPHVVKVYEHVEGWAVLEYAPGGSLAGRQLSPVEAARIGAQIADALVYMHAEGLVHCDVKPGNIVLAGDGLAKLTDFGSAYRLDPEATITPATQLSFTPAYAAPELVRGSPVPASDVYSLAATVRALAGELPGLAELLSADPRDRPDAAGARRLFQAVADGVPPSLADVGPAQLPTDVYGFIGRAAELARLDRLAREPARVVVISGTAGVGKTTLAVHWAHRISTPTRRSRTNRHFSDGQLYVDLRGFDPSGQVVDPADAVRGFLHALGVPPERIPATLDAQAALYRSRLAGKRVLVVLDNARDSEQVRPLLPGSATCLAIVTSRNDLIGLITKEGARSLTLDVLSAAEARQLLDRRIGSDRIAAEPAAVQDIIDSCARLPLALAIVAARAAIQPDFPLAALTNAFASADPDTDVRAVFSWSYRQLSHEAQRLFRLLGLHPGPDISAAAAASLLGGHAPLAELARAHLVDEPVPGRYRFHDLLRAYANELAGAEDRPAATRRMLDHYLHTAFAADRVLAPQRDPISLPARVPGVTPEPMPGLEQAMSWFGAERSVLRAVLETAAGEGFDEHAWPLAWASHNFLFRQGYWQEQIEAWDLALAATRRLGDRAAEARVHGNVAFIYTRLGDRLDSALGHLQEALQLNTELDFRAAQGHTHYRLTQVYERKGQPAEALSHAERAYELYEEVGHRSGQAVVLNSMGWYNAELGRYEVTLEYCRKAIELFEELGEPYGAAAAWDSLGYAHHHLDQLPEASECYQRALGLYREHEDRYRVAETLSHLGDTQYAAGDVAAAGEGWEQALRILDELEHADAEGVRLKLERLDRPPPTAQAKDEPDQPGRRS